ncbi:DNA repair protein RecN [Cysteiniphilum halobium]|uniref:DNA repair protein RecN n=1 Tax=Cysteiniphilum halobium TaxID=2219059 RepID=UPI000E656173|nr:DNA repair protein RecN [Cysteiniphilum halobium]
MLNFLGIKNFAIIKNSEIHFKSGMTTITGETGAGKSILLDALNIVLGTRVDKSTLTSDAPCEISAIFDISKIPHAKTLLNSFELAHQDDECLLRRVIQRDGKTRAFINGSLVTLAQLKQLSEQLISIYGQNAHHSLLDPTNQLIRLDTYAGLTTEVDEVTAIFKKLSEINALISDEKERIEKDKTALALMQYQYDELVQLNLGADELTKLDQEHKSLANAEAQIHTIAQVVECINDNEQSLLGTLDQLIHQLNTYNENSAFKSIYSLLTDAKVYLKEAEHEARHLLDHLEINPEKLQQIDQRLNEIYQLARKHKLDPKQLYLHIAELEQKISAHAQNEQKLMQLTQEKSLLEEAYLAKATALSNKRQAASKKFAGEIQQYIRQLNIPKGEFYAHIIQGKTKHANGIDHCDFLINFNPGQQPAPIDKVASGGELSRIGLAIHVIASKKIAPPTIIFDEVDVGISGGTAEIVGKLLKQVSKNAQILCITHQAQVSIQGDQQLHISKKHLEHDTISEVLELNKEERINETARIIGGVDITDKALQHAKEMYELYHK